MTHPEQSAPLPDDVADDGAPAATRRLLLVDDDAAFRRLYGSVLEGAGYRVDEADDRDSARAAVSAEAYPVVILDLMLPPDGSVEAGLAQLAEILAAHPATKVVVASGAGDVAFMLRAVKAGAYDFLTKPVDPDVLLTVVARGMTKHALEAQIQALQERLVTSRADASMLGESAAFREAVSLAERVATADLPVLVTGENGTGKELMARALHMGSRRRDGPFVAVNCGALTESLLESTLFGHVKGAFTGAVKDRKGLFAEASGGTLFLDEIGEMPPALQVKVLRAIEYGEILPVGRDRTEQVDVRIVSATNRDLVAMTADGTFREDLYWRVKGAEVRLPALRERADDIPLLAAHFLNQAASLAADGRPRTLSPAARARLMAHTWPGNMRELRHEMQRATVLAGERQEIVAADLGIGAGPPGAASPAGPGAGETATDAPLQEKVEALERREIAAALSRHEGNRTRAAEALGLSRQGLLKKMGRYGLA